MHENYAELEPFIARYREQLHMRHSDNPDAAREPHASGEASHRPRVDIKLTYRP